MITGAGGQLGTALLKVFSTKSVELFPQTHSQLDITDFKQVWEAVESYHPDVVINAAAFTNVDLCETQPSQAFRTNFLGQKNLTITSENVGAITVYISTDYIFDGEKNTPYREYDAPHPVNIYGESKWWGERATLEHTSRFLIVRTSYLYGQGGENFPSKILRKAKAGETLRLIHNQFFSPSYTLDIAEGISHLILNDCMGIFHLTNSGESTPFTFAEAILREFGVTARLEKVDYKSVRLPARRPQNSVLENFHWGLLRFPPLRPWQEALKDFTASLLPRIL